MTRRFPRDSAPPFPLAVAAAYAAHAARVEAQTPGLHCPLPYSTETCDGARQRIALMMEESYRLRFAALGRAIAAGWPGITAETPFEASFFSDPDPVGDFMRAEAAAKASLSARAARRAA